MKKGDLIAIIDCTGSLVGHALFMSCRDVDDPSRPYRKDTIFTALFEGYQQNFHSHRYRAFLYNDPYITSPV